MNKVTLKCNFMEYHLLLKMKKIFLNENKKVRFHHTLLLKEYISNLLGVTITHKFLYFYRLAHISFMKIINILKIILCFYYC